jgi:apolipoprotein N-acyltransferase
MLYRYRLPILAGLLIGTSYIPFPPWALFFCLVPLWLFTLRTDDVKHAFIGGWITQFIFNLIGFHWVAYTVVEFGHFPWPVGILVLLLFCATAHLYYPVSGALWVWLKRRYGFGASVLGVFFLTTLFALSERLFPVLFPWHLGYSWLWAKFPGSYVADIIGFEGLNVLTLMINTLALLSWQAAGHPKRRWALAGTAVALFAAVNIFGFIRNKNWNDFDAEIKVLAVQGNIGNFEKIAAEKGQGYQREIVQRYMNGSRAGLDKHPEADVILWPETAFPDYLDSIYQNGSHASALRAFTRSVGRPLMSGAYSHNPATKQTFNGFFFVDENGAQARPPYHKTILLAFGEYFPGADLVPFVSQMFPQVSAFGRGTGPTMTDWHGWKIGPQICYESLYPWFSRALASQGAEFFVNITNDSWFGTRFEPYQHLYMTFARAIEFRRPLIRATNTGITTAILANGEILEMSPLHTEWFGLLKVPYKRQPSHTIYEHLEPLWPWLLLVTAIALFRYLVTERRAEEGK